MLSRLVQAWRNLAAGSRAVDGSLESTVVAARSAEERYARVMLAARAGFWDWDLVKN